MPNPDQYKIWPISIFCTIALSKSISIFPRMSSLSSISIFSRIYGYFSNCPLILISISIFSKCQWQCNLPYLISSKHGLGENDTRSSWKIWFDWDSTHSGFDLYKGNFTPNMIDLNIWKVDQDWLYCVGEQVSKKATFPSKAPRSRTY